MAWSTEYEPQPATINVKHRENTITIPLDELPCPHIMGGYDGGVELGFDGKWPDKTFEQIISTLEAGRIASQQKGNGFVIEKETLFHDASVSNRNVEVVKLLITENADIHAKSNIGWTPLHSAAYGGNVEVVKVLGTFTPSVENAWENPATTFCLGHLLKFPKNLLNLFER